MTDDDDEERVMPRTREQWAMACALEVERQHGSRGPLHIATMIGKFAYEGDDCGIDNWVEIARAYDQLMRSGSAGPH